METKRKALLNIDGSAFSGLASVASALDALDSEGRKTYRDDNASVIATSAVVRLLVVAGPGAGKTLLFLDRIVHWIRQDASGHIRVASFVRKLVTDLKAAMSTHLSAEDQARVEATTLHALARGILERSHGTSSLHLGPHVRIIDSDSAWMVWDDVLEFHSKLRGAYHLLDLQRQLRTEQYDNSDEWKALRRIYADLCSFFNAVGFEYLIVLAREAIKEKPDLVDAKYWIFDEYQDFNHSEDDLVRALTTDASGVVLAGDDDQALYQWLKDSHPEIIGAYYADSSYANALLPFCSRSSYYICLAAAAFIEKHRAANSIPKVYVPVEVDTKAYRVQIVATWAPGTASSYVEKFLDNHRDELAEYRDKRDAGTETDPFLLVLMPGGSKWLSRCGYDDLHDVLATYSDVGWHPSDDYLLLALYATAGWSEADNFAVRKVLHAEGISAADAHDLIVEAQGRGSPLAVVVEEQRPETIKRIREVTDAVTKHAEDFDQACKLIGQLLPLAAPDALAEELKRHPLKRSSRVEEQEEPVETGGTLPAVAQMTIVGSKGLSARHVIVLGCDDVNMNKVSELAFYVALTRARQSLHLLIAGHSGGAKQVHKFLADLPADCCDYVIYKKTDGSTAPLDGLKGLRGYFTKLTWAASH